MSQYRPPLKDIAFLLEDVLHFDEHAKRCSIDCDTATVLAIAEEAGKFASAVIDPINRSSDKAGAHWENSEVVTAQGYPQAYASFCEGGWNGLRFPEQYGGQGLCSVVATVADEMWHAASLSFALCPMLTNGAIQALLTAGDNKLKETYLSNLVSGKWTGTMNLTEPQAGSDLAAVQCKALPQEDGCYRLHGQKIFITYGEHDMAENIIHLVLARTPSAPKGVKGISLFVVPKFLVGTDGTLGRRNDVRCASIEHKLGIHGSPTAVMLFGERDGAIGYLVGEENRGLEYMFIMMNEARFSVGLQGLSVSDRAYQHALAYALERVQGRAIGDSSDSPIIRHPDVRRMLLSMKCKIEAMRAFAVYVAMQKDLAETHPGCDQRPGEPRARMELLIPVMKGWLTENAQGITYDALQVFGGMGFIEETGAAQYYRDARILTIYEGTTAIQANDLVGRKTLRDGGKAAQEILVDVLKDAAALNDIDCPTARQLSAQLILATEALQRTVQWMLEFKDLNSREVYAGSVPYLKLWGVVCGGWMHALRLLAAARRDSEMLAAAAPSASFFGNAFLSNAPALATAITVGGQAVIALQETDWLESQ